ncbi:ATP-dependent DNA ligase [Algoriphagus sediminis]|uniref:DNA ligase (ATP) n=1 Tax=Algoriphagus sediminis TaxID=3057113 RepID=A0ABT7YDP5_9BACT|nr:ATP-dependent DNA ligase [Algoriphagus sediminis]MDN3204631.1 ATP-dependent DNA ligase [Algoriphagus sediminis]
MLHFAQLISALDVSNKTKDKITALTQFFDEASNEDKVWAIALFTHRRPKRQVKTNQLREWCIEKSGIPHWLFEESYHTVGDLAETIALLLPHPSTKSDLALAEWIRYLMDLSDKEEAEKKEKILSAWSKLNKTECFIFNKILTGGFRIGVSQNLITQALSGHLEMEKSTVSHCLMGDWNPAEITYEELLSTDSSKKDLSKPYPFFLAHPLEKDVKDLGLVSDWQVEWKWDGIRGQLIKRSDEVFVWSRGEELVNDKFPELVSLGESLPNGTVLDGEILAFRDGGPLPFNLLQTRIGRKTVGKKLLQDAPISLLAYDLLEFDGKDLRSKPLHQRRQTLENLVIQNPHPNLEISSPIVGESWEELKDLREESRKYFAEGFMLKEKSSSYEAGRKRGGWWKWKIDPLTIDGVMIYAQKGHGRRADLYSDYTLAVWDGDALVPFAKAYSGLTDAEMREVDAFVKKNTRERFGPVRTVTAELVFEIAFEGIQKSSRHKSGIALRFPRISRWRKDKPKEEANSLEDLKDMLNLYGG